MEEEQVDENLLAFDEEALLAAHEAEVAAAERLDGPFDVGGERPGEDALVEILVAAGVDIVEIDEVEDVLVAEGTHGARRERHRGKGSLEVVRELADVAVVVRAEMLEQLLVRPKGRCRGADVVPGLAFRPSRSNDLPVL